MHIRDIAQERREKFALLGSNDYIMLPSGEIRRRQPKPYKNKAERKALKRQVRDARREAVIG